MSARTGPSALRWLVVAPLWAGALGAGLFICAAGALVVLDEDHVIRGSTAGIAIVLAGFVATGVALFRGYDTPVRSYPALAGRLAGGLGAGAVVGAGVVLINRWLEDHGYVHERAHGLAVAGALVALLAIGRLHGRRFVDLLRASASMRWKAAILAAVVALAFEWTTRPRVRCAFRSGDGCHLAARRALNAGDGVLAVALAEHGCALDDAGSCTYAGQLLWHGTSGAVSSVPSDPGRAEDSFGIGCALGSRDACQDLNALELTQRCEAYSASACRALAEVYRTGAGVYADTDEARRCMRQACLLGDAVACGAP
jgi:hypothetical protein